VTARPISQTDYETLARFRHALRVFQRFSEDAARAAGLTPAQHQLILAVKGWAGDERPTIGEVADVLQLKHHSAVELVQRAAAAGLVETVADREDGRRQRLTDAQAAGAARLAAPAGGGSAGPGGGGGAAGPTTRLVGAGQAMAPAASARGRHAEAGSAEDLVGVLAQARHGSTGVDALNDRGHCGGRRGHLRVR
jgi:DNA-binding MarR family transcriptional regulator